MEPSAERRAAPEPAGTPSGDSPPYPADEGLTPRPINLWRLYTAFNWLALQGFGGVLAVAQRELVEKHRWMSREEFVETLAIAQVLPGPNIVNISLMIGDRFFGLRGAFAALAGMLLVPSILVIALAALYGHLASHPVAVNALRGMGIVSAGLILATGVKLLTAVRKNPMGQWQAVLLAASTIAAIVWLKIPLPWLVLVLGGTGMALVWRKLKQ
jgi:chromate transporter